MTNVVITGSTKGIGLGLARGFADLGCNVVVTGRTRNSVDTALIELGPRRGRIIGHILEASDFDCQRGLWDKAIREFGSVDIWVNNAGLARTIWPIVETPTEQVEAMLDTNMRGTIFGSLVAAQGMLDQGGGKIFNVLGGGSDGEQLPGIGIYGTTKRGLDYFCRALARELADTGVIVGRVRPGMVITHAVVREAKADPENFQKSRKTINKLVDSVETVAPFLVSEMVEFQKSGGMIRWLTGGKIAMRMLKGMFVERPDQFADYGL